MKSNNNKNDFLFCIFWGELTEAEYHKSKSVIFFILCSFLVSPLHKTTENFKLNNQDLIQVQIFRINSRGFTKKSFNFYKL